ncbi:DUF302 domain-containing protein [Halostella salina]|uniref:DUF302 domain-containing protein n=1 Tax=Halostella salina TaxID=1547897 RepID=UPI000EF847B7|nr:DUF302 domain-containing protein [Halostella salina]
MTVPANSAYTIDRSVEGSFEGVVDQTTDALAEEGFGVLCDIDVQHKFEEKLDEEFPRYRILGACNPPLAHQALDEEFLLGTLLPCNVIVYEMGDGSVGVSAVDPETMLSVVDDSDLDVIATEVKTRLQNVLNALPAA